MPKTEELESPVTRGDLGTFRMLSSKTDITTYFIMNSSTNLRWMWNVNAACAEHSVQPFRNSKHVRHDSPKRHRQSSLSSLHVYTSPMQVCRGGRP